MPYYTYILYSKSFDKFYVGQTEDKDARLLRHNSGYEKATSPYCPWEMIWYAEKTTRGDALLLEKKLKNLSKQRVKDFITKYS